MLVKCGAGTVSQGHLIGKDVMIDGTDFQVIGVVEKPKGGFGMGDEDRRVLIPFNTFKKTYPAADELNMRVQAYPGRLDQMVDEATEILRRRRNVAYNAKSNFSVGTAAESVEEFHKIMLMVYLATFVLSGIGLLIGGVGVMNIMLVSVTERTREWGEDWRQSRTSPAILMEAMTLTARRNALIGNGW
jgi:putative ABC transport system permease protein